MTPEFVALGGFALLAGFVDAVVGGGGLVLLPALLVLLPGVPVATLLGTNKSVSIWGTTVAAVHYARHVEIPWRTVVPMGSASLVFSLLGARAVSSLDPDLVRPIVLALLVVVLAYTLHKRDFGSLHAPRLSPRGAVVVGGFAGASIGFYEGFLGPGAGSFLVLAFVGLFGFSFLHASAAAKAVNAIASFGALLWFLSQGLVLLELTLPLAACNVAGSQLGSRLAIRRGSGFVRVVFLVVAVALIGRLGWDLLRAG
jgi:uncharacterized membrane protein YfcA